jgi:hypothetical protein
LAFRGTTATELMNQSQAEEKHPKGNKCFTI